MNKLTELPNIGITLAGKLRNIDINSEAELASTGSEKTLLQLATLPNSGVCLNMLYALEGAIQGIRWHGLDKIRKLELKEFYNSMRS